MPLRTVSAVEAGSQDQDRVALVPALGAQVLVLADGAGGRGGGREAAEGVIRLVADQARALALGSLEPVDLLAAVDAALAGDRAAGESTAVVVVISGSHVHGASVGDSGAWLVTENRIVDLTRHQIRKPMLGSGSAVPVPFGPVDLEGRLLLASDGLLKYAPRDRLMTTALTLPLEQTAMALIESVRLPSGGLQDDVAVIVCEHHHE